MNAERKGPLQILHATGICPPPAECTQHAYGHHDKWLPLMRESAQFIAELGEQELGASSSSSAGKFHCKPPVG